MNKYKLTVTALCLLPLFSNCDNNSANKTQDESQTFTVNGVFFEMMKVEGGTFDMGVIAEWRDFEEEFSGYNDDGEDPFFREKPLHKVTLTRNYYIGKTEVTQALWKAVMGYNPSNFIGDQKPVDCVSWIDCQHFITKLNVLTGKNFRLPTEAEWEFAAQGGNKSHNTIFSGSNNLNDVAWYYENSENTTHDVATKQPNELGIYDMSGNVWEWCSDWFDDYDQNHQTDPTGPAKGTSTVHRGSAWNEDSNFGRTSYRDFDDPDRRCVFLGVRLALSE